jgi:hypothetical protein
MITHDLDISKWPGAMFAKWLALVNKTPTLKWNCKVLDPAKVSARSTKLAVSSLTITSAAAAKS